MNTNEKLTEVLNDLIRINNDRTTGYVNASDEAKIIDVDLQATFNKMADQSRKFAAQLTNEVSRLGGEAATGTTNSGKIHRAWMDVKATFSGKDRHAILSSCEFGEDAAQKAYKAALASDAEISAETRQLITDQQSSLKTSHDLIKKYRDVQEAVNS
ncbi:PA2169 family four-helix-bundle protein [Ginsengibacter hankyongi]|uniref:PA2169 family four-helix-bundle protein n=1 Tax=Ginsengibacter hankyongi TaxID=2607284 RepID=A0A5J5IJQ0_9BACT|nr:PA2169 family four-helix-bundle protein [Ginsengibacter hankyongi]KAA9041269.1 PA2169 family four-helix-bundle protein [Ginsengibacter hankyongi]